MIKNLSESTLKNIRKEGCFINKMLSDGLASCTAIQDGHVFICPFNMLRNVRDIKKDNQKLYSETSRRCACGHPTCDIDAISVKKILTQMGLQVNVVIVFINSLTYTHVHVHAHKLIHHQVPLYKRVQDWKSAKKILPHLREGNVLEVIFKV